MHDAATLRTAAQLMREEDCLTGVAIIQEPGGDNMPTIHGRSYCPRCQDEFNAWLDDGGRTP